MDANNTNICILDGKALNPGDLSWTLLTQFGNVETYETTKPDQVLSRAANSDIIITNKVVLDAKIIRQLPRLKCIVVTATGYNNVDIQTANSLGVVVCNAPNYSTQSVAQHAFALLLHIYNSIGPYSKDTTQGKWSLSQCFCSLTYPTFDLAGKTIGIVGLGNIGLRTAAIAHAFGMKVIALTSKCVHELPEYIVKVDESAIFVESDVLTLHVPLVPQTKNFVNSDILKHMKPDAVIINTARGALVDEQAVADALRAKRIAAYAADVLSTEPPAADNPLLAAPNAYITPHIAWATKESRQRLFDITVNNVKAFLEGTPINRIV
jgi:glycerate dehydrogenase